jgi:hypothetical protein
MRICMFSYNKKERKQCSQQIAIVILKNASPISLQNAARSSPHTYPCLSPLGTSPIRSTSMRFFASLPTCTSSMKIKTYLSWAEYKYLRTLMGKHLDALLGGLLAPLNLTLVLSVACSLVARSVMKYFNPNNGLKIMFFY